LIIKCDYVEDKPTILNCEEIFKNPLIAVDMSPCSDIVVSTLRTFENDVEKATFLHVIDYGSMD